MSKVSYYRITTLEDSRLVRPQEMKFNVFQLIADDSVQNDDLKQEYLQIDMYECPGDSIQVTLRFHCVKKRGFYYLCCTDCDTLELVPERDAMLSEPKYKFRFLKHADARQIESVEKEGWFLDVEGRILKMKTGKERYTLFRLETL